MPLLRTEQLEGQAIRATLMRPDGATESVSLTLWELPPGQLGNDALPDGRRILTVHTFGNVPHASGRGCACSTCGDARRAILDLLAQRAYEFQIERATAPLPPDEPALPSEVVEQLERSGSDVAAQLATVLRAGGHAGSTSFQTFCAFLNYMVQRGDVTCRSFRVDLQDEPVPDELSVLNPGAAGKTRISLSIELGGR